MRRRGHSQGPLRLNNAARRLHYQTTHRLGEGWWAYLFMGVSCLGALSLSLLSTVATATLRSNTHGPRV